MIQIKSLANKCHNTRSTCAGSLELCVAAHERDVADIHELPLREFVIRTADFQQHLSISCGSNGDDHTSAIGQLFHGITHPLGQHVGDLSTVLDLT